MERDVKYDNVLVKQRKNRARMLIPLQLDLAVLLNAAVVVFGLVYLAVPRLSGAWALYDVLLLGTLGLNFWMVSKTGFSSRGPVSQKLRIYGKIYLWFMVAAMIGLLFANTLLDNAYKVQLQEHWLAFVIIYLSYFGIFVLGACLGGLVRKEQGALKVAQSRTDRREKRVNIWNLAGQLLCYVILLVGALMAFVLVTGFRLGLLEIIIPPYATFFALIILAVLIMLTRLLNTKGIQYYATLTVGFLIVAICLLPLLLAPVTVNRAEHNFTAAFGEGWQSRIPAQVQKYFRGTPFSAAASLLGIRTGDCAVEQDVLFYEGTSGVDQGVKLYFDAFLPPAGVSSLPGGRSTIIRIHGGAWVAGDKGVYNMLAMNKYLAAQGYTVFDIQYGLSSTSTFNMNLPTPEHVRGDFSIDDMLRHVGLFIGYLAEHNDDYRANLQSVFISGGSAGGHLTTAAALGIASNRYGELFGDLVTIKGLIPYYPANNIARKGGIPGTEELMNPDLLVTQVSPPALVFQGTHDSLVPAAVSARFKETYTRAGNPACAVLWMPLGGHASDLNFSGSYNQIFLYYMERFLYLFR